MTAPADPRAGAERESATCRHCPQTIWPLKATIDGQRVLWEDECGLTVCAKAGPGEMFLHHEPMPMWQDEQQPLSDAERARWTEARQLSVAGQSTADPAVTRLTIGFAGRIMRDWHARWAAGWAGTADATATWPNDPKFTLARIEGDGHSLYVVPDLAGWPEDARLSEWRGFAVLDVRDDLPLDRIGAELRLGFVTYGDALRHAAIKVCDERRSGYPPGEAQS